MKYSVRKIYKKIIRSSDMETKRISKAPTAPYQLSSICLKKTVWHIWYKASRWWDWKVGSCDSGGQRHQVILSPEWRDTLWQHVRTMSGSWQDREHVILCFCAISWWASCWHRAGSLKCALKPYILFKGMPFWDGFSCCSVARQGLDSALSSTIHHPKLRP